MNHLNKLLFFLVMILVSVNLAGCPPGVEKTTHTVIPKAGAGGSISPDSPQKVDDGSKISFTVTPDTGYAIGSITGCGGTLAGNVYTTGPVKTDCTVTASFTANATQAVLTLSTSGSLPAGVSGIGSIDVTIILPEGAAVKATENPPQTDIGVVTASGAAAANSTLIATYTPSSAGIRGRVRVLLANSSPDGIAAGEFAEIVCDIGGAAPGAQEFSAESATLKVYGIDTTSNSTPDISADITVGIGAEFQ